VPANNTVKLKKVLFQLVDVLSRRAVYNVDKLPYLHTIDQLQCLNTADKLL